MAGCRRVTASSRRPRRRATSRGRRPVCAGSPRPGRRRGRRRRARRGPVAPRPGPADARRHRPSRRPSGWVGGSRRPTRPAPRRTAAAHPAGRVTAGSARSASRCRCRSAPGRVGAVLRAGAPHARCSRGARQRGALDAAEVAVLERLADAGGRRQPSTPGSHPLGCTATCGRATCCGPPTRRCSSTPRRTVATARPTWRCWRCSGHRTSSGCSPPTTRRPHWPTAGANGCCCTRCTRCCCTPCCSAARYGAQARARGRRYV